MEISEYIRGACLCGAIAFELRPSHLYGPDRAMGVCHCPRCQRWSGGAALPFVVALPEHFRVAAGQQFMAHYRDDTSAIRTFCRRCGSNLFEDTGTTYFVCAGVLDDLTLTPGFHLEASHRPAWAPNAGDVPKERAAPTSGTNVKDIQKGGVMRQSLAQMVAAARSEAQLISPAKAAEAQRHAELKFIVDVREPGEYRQGHLPGAINIPRGMLEMRADPGSPVADASLCADQSARIAVYCTKDPGARSLLSAQTLGSMGYASVEVLGGGLMAWSQAGLPVEGGDDQPAKSC